MKLDINENNLILDIPNKYYLDIKLSYPVFADKGNAKYDPKTKKLKISMVINQLRITEKMQEQEIQEKIEEEKINEEKIQEEKTEKKLKEEKTEEKFNEKKTEEIISEVKIQEIEEIKFEKEKNNDDFLISDSLEKNEDFNENNDNLLEFQEKNSILKMVNEPKITENMDENKPLIEELSGENIENLEENKKKQEELNRKTKIPMKLDFKTQENSQKFFLIIHIPHYSKENCQFRIISNEVF